jgi:IMP cyclohydrolase
MNGYVAFYNNKRIEVHAETLYAAKQKAIVELKVPKKREHMVSVVLAEKDGEQVTHTADF